MQMQAGFLTRHPGLRDVLNFAGFVTLVLVGTLFINAFIFRSFNVSGHSMENTLHDGDRLIVNRVPVTLAQIQNKQYIPNRGQIIVFKNPQWVAGSEDEFIVKRVIAFPGERVTVKDGKLTVYNHAHPDGYSPDDDDRNGHPKSDTSGSVDTVVSEGTLFVSGDNRVGNNSYDSRSGLGLIPFYDVIGPVSIRIWPLNALSTF